MLRKDKRNGKWYEIVLVHSVSSRAVIYSVGSVTSGGRETSEQKNQDASDEARERERKKKNSDRHKSE